MSHELSPLVRYVTRGDTTVLNAYLALPLRALRASSCTQELRALDPQARLTLMQSNGGLAAAERFHAMSSVLSGPAGGLIGMRWVGERLQLAAPDRLRHGRHLHGRVADRRRAAAALRAPDRRRAPRPADAGRAQHRRRRRLDPRLPRRALRRRPGLGRRRPWAGLLRARRAPDPHRCAGAARATARRHAAGGVRPRGPRAHRRPDRWRRSSPPWPRALPARSPAAAPPKRSPNRSSRSVSSRWPMPSARSPRAAGSMRPTSRCSASAAPPVSMPAASRAPRACDASWCIRWRACCRRSASASPTGWRCGARACARRSGAGRAGGGAQRAGGARNAQARAELAATESLRRGAGDAAARAARRRQRRHPLGAARRARAVRARFRAEHLRRFGFAAERARGGDRGAARRGPRALRWTRRRSRWRAARLPARRCRAGARLVRRLARGAAGADGRAARRAARSGADRRAAQHAWCSRKAGACARLAGGELLLSDSGAARAVPAERTADPARIEIFNNLFMHIAEQMGEVLKATAQSVNIRERLDYSCALFDAARRPGGQRAAHAGASGLDGRERARGHRGAARQLAPGRLPGSSTAPITAARTCRT